MKRLKNYGIAASGVVLLTVAVSWSGFGQALASEARAAVQKVSITNKSIAVSGIVNADPSAPTEPVQFTTRIDIPKTAGGVTPDNIKAVTTSNDAYTVPSGKRLVIEYVTVDATGIEISTTHMLANFGVAGGAVFFIPLQAQGDVGTSDEGQGFHLVGSEMVKAYVDAGKVVTASAVHDYVFTAESATFSFSGYLTSVK